jgi:hypothetical protein
MEQEVEACWKDSVKPRETSEIAGLRNESWTLGLPNREKEY